MRWWAKAGVVAGVFVLAACSSTAGGGSAGTPSGNRSSGPSADKPPPTPPSTAPLSPTLPSTVPSASAGGCAAGHAEVTVSPGDAVEQRLCVRPATVVSLILEPRTDDRRWTAVLSSAPALVVASGWRLDADGTARASLRCAGARGGRAEITALAKAPDVAGAPRVAFTLHVSVVPYTTQG